MVHPSPIHTTTLNTLESDRYDQQTHERLTKAAFDHCEAYSAEVEAQVSNGEGSSSQAAASPPPATPTKARKKPLKPKTPVKPKAASRRTPQPTEPAPLVVDLMALVGTTVKQSFDGVWYNAKVSFVKPYYRLTFTEDGDEQDMTSADFKSLTEGVFEGARLRYHCGVPWLWADVIVRERYEGRRTHGAIWEADDQPYGSTARDACVGGRVHQRRKLGADRLAAHPKGGGRDGICSGYMDAGEVWVSQPKRECEIPLCLW